MTSLALDPALWTIAAFWGAAAVTPGPDFLAIASSSVGGGRLAGLAAVIGILCGTVVWGLAGFFGVAVLFAAAPWLYIGLKLAGAAYLLYVGLLLIRSSLRSAPDPALIEGVRVSPGRAFGRGLGANLSNPKTAILMASIFATMLPPSPSLGLGLITVALVTVVSAVWYLLIALVLTAPPLQRAYRKAERAITFAAGALFGAFAVRLALEKT
jgi:threonine/homoserine/homoserine lactone efflux protein